MFKFIDLIKINEEEINKIEDSFSENITLPWDPINNFNLDLVKRNSSKLLAKLEYLKKNPDKPRKQRLYSFLFSIIILILIIIITFTSPIFIQILIIFLFFSLIPLIYIISYYKNLSKDLIKIQIAKEYNYFYDPEKNTNRWNFLKQRFPELFNKGNNSQHVEDEFWGQINKNNINYHFYSGLFTYSIRRSNGKRTSNTTYHKHFFAIKLNKHLNSRFHLYPENIFSKIGNFFTKKEINTESLEFNKTFAFSYNGSKNEKALNIVKAMSPAVQTNLLDLNEKKGEMEILFSNECVFFMFKHQLLNTQKTDLFKDININPEDKKIIENKLNELIEISSEIAKYLD